MGPGHTGLRRASGTASPRAPRTREPSHGRDPAIEQRVGKALVERLGGFLGALGPGLGLARDHQREPDGFEKDRADRHSHAGLRSKLHQFTALIEARAAGFDLVEPSEGPLDRGVRAGIRVDDVNAYQRAHHGFGADGHADCSLTAHLALLSASTTA